MANEDRMQTVAGALDQFRDRGYRQEMCPLRFLGAECAPRASRSEGPVLEAMKGREPEARSCEESYFAPMVSPRQSGGCMT